MKIFTLSFFFVLLCYMSIAQVFSVSVLSNKENTLYIGRKNVVEVPYLTSGMTVKMAKGKLEDFGNKRFIVTEPACGNITQDTMFFYSGKKLLVQKVFSVSYNGAPLAAIGGKTCLDSVNIDDIYKAQELKVFPDSLQYQITNFAVLLLPQRGEIQGPYASSTGKMLHNQLELLDSAKIGSRIFFDGIEASCKSCKNKKISLDPLMMIVTEKNRLKSAR